MDCVGMSARVAHGCAGTDEVDAVKGASLRQDAGTTPAQTSQSTPMSRPARPDG